MDLSDLIPSHRYFALRVQQFLRKLLMGETPALDSSFKRCDPAEFIIRKGTRTEVKPPNGLSRKTALSRFAQVGEPAQRTASPRRRQAHWVAHQDTTEPAVTGFPQSMLG